MNRRKLVALAASAPLAMAQPGQRSLRERLLGSWKLISWEETNPATGAVIYPCGKNATGRLMYDAAGRMAAQIMDPDRKNSGVTHADNPDYARSVSAEDVVAAFTHYRAYYGAYAIDEVKRTVTHHVEGELVPVNVGTDRVRNVGFLSDDRIVLTYPYNGRENRLVWDRERP